jgi:hypothetical protein
VRATIDGAHTHFYEWYAAGRVSAGAGSAMHRGTGVVRALYYGFDEGRLVLRLDPLAAAYPTVTRLRLEFGAPVPRRIEVGPLDRPAPEVRATSEPGPVPGTECRLGKVLEIAIPIAALGATEGDTIELAIQVLGADGPVETLPGDDLLRMTVPGSDFELHMWSA